MHGGCWCRSCPGVHLLRGGVTIASSFRHVSTLVSLIYIHIYMFINSNSSRRKQAPSNAFVCVFFFFFTWKKRKEIAFLSEVYQIITDEKRVHSRSIVFAFFAFSAEFTRTPVVGESLFGCPGLSSSVYGDFLWVRGEVWCGLRCTEICWCAAASSSVRGLQSVLFSGAVLDCSQMLQFTPRHSPLRRACPKRVCHYLPLC